MAIRVELTDDAVTDLARYAVSGNLPLVLKKLSWLEAVGTAAGLPLGGALSGYRTIVVGDRNWRIIFTTDAEETVATVLVIGDRDEAACYEKAQRRLEAMGARRPEAVSLAAAMFQIDEMQRAGKKRGRRRPQSSAKPFQMPEHVNRRTSAMSRACGIDLSELDERTRQVIHELRRIIASQYPATTFELVHSPEDSTSLHLLAVADVDDPDEVGDLVVERVVALQVEEGIPLHVIPLRSLERIEEASGAGLLGRGST